MRLAIFGGTFDPIHLAHMAVAREAADACALDRVLVVPNANPPHKTGQRTAGYEDRYCMVELACRQEARLVASRLEEYEPRSYSILTIEKVQAQLASADELYFLIGADAFAELSTWFRHEDVARAVTFIVASRPRHTYAVPDHARVIRLETLALDVSSSEVRRRLAAGEKPSVLDPLVYAYICEHGLYRQGAAA